MAVAHLWPPAAAAGRAGSVRERSRRPRAAGIIVEIFIFYGGEEGEVGWGSIGLTVRGIAHVWESTDDPLTKTHRAW
ncbi:hypothetical protein JCM14720_10590 [Calditerricola yamamurae]